MFRIRTAWDPIDKLIKAESHKCTKIVNLRLFYPFWRFIWLFLLLDMKNRLVNITICAISN